MSHTNIEVNLGGSGARKDTLGGVNTYLLFNFGLEKEICAAKKNLSEILLPVYDLEINLVDCL